MIVLKKIVQYNLIGNMIIRERYIDKIRPFYESDLVKVIVGIRRCGKSVILNQIMDEISKKTDNIIYLNFEKTADWMKASNAQQLVAYVGEHRKAGKCYLFFDEIQELSGWEMAIKDFRLGNNSVFITGSNSKLLSHDITTRLSGRYVKFQVRPFVYSEIAECLKEYGREASINDYLIWGGFPGRFALDSIEAQKAYLSDLEETIIYKDLVKRYRIRKDAIFKKIVNFVLCNNSRILSSRSIARYVNAECGPISLNTVMKFIEYLKEAYIIDDVPQYSTKSKRELAYYQKLYDADVCFNSLSKDDNRFDLDHNLENIVYNELLYRGYKLRVYDNNGKEIDFRAVKDGKEYFIQVAYSLVDQKAYEREFSAFEGLSSLSKMIIISNDENDYSTASVKHIRLRDFLAIEDFGF